MFPDLTPRTRGKLPTEADLSLYYSMGMIRSQTRNITSTLEYKVDGARNWMHFQLEAKYKASIGDFGFEDPYMSIFTYDFMWKKVSSVDMDRNPNDSHKATANVLCDLDELCANDPNRKFRFQFAIQKESSSSIIGEVELNLDQIMHSLQSNDSKGLEITDDRKRLTGAIRFSKAEVVLGTSRGVIKSKQNQSRLFADPTDEILYFHLEGKNFEKMDFFGKADPYLEVYRQVGSDWERVHRTEVYHNTLAPRYKPFCIDAKQLCDGYYDRPLLIKAFDFNARSASDFIGEIQTTARALLSATDSRRAKIKYFNLKDPAKVGNKGYRYGGQIWFKSAQVFSCLTDLQSQSAKEGFLPNLQAQDRIYQYAEAINSGKPRHAWLKARKRRMGEKDEKSSASEAKSNADNNEPARQRAQKKGKMYISFSCRNLPQAPGVGLSDPFLQIFKLEKTESKYIQVHQTEPILNTCNPDFPVIKAKIPDMLGTTTGTKTKLLIRIWDWNSRSDNQLIGEFNISYRDLYNGTGRTFDIINKKKMEELGDQYINSGTLKINSITIEKKDKKKKKKKKDKER